jgi:peptidoglycan/xylan/chitin deacetylase (PgdA/CDA1 family)
MKKSKTLPGWRISEDALRSIASEISAGKTLVPESWPDHSRVAVLLSFDVDTQTWELMHGGHPSPCDLSQGEYGARVGLGRIVDLLADFEIPASFFVPAVSAILHPSIVDTIRSNQDHEIGVHGWVHEHPSWLEPDEELTLMERSLDVLTEQGGTRPVGYRAPAYDLHAHTFEILQKLDFLYDSSLMADDRPYEILAKGEPTGLVELPVEWLRDDATVLDPRGENYMSPREWLRTLIDEFDVAYEEKTVFSVTMHPRTMGHRSRIVVLRELIEHIQGKGDVWFATHGQAATEAHKLLDG